MAYYSIFPEKDTTLYSHPGRIGLNTGHDEIIEIVKEKGTSDVRYYPSRILIKFKTSEIQDILTNKITTAVWSSSLELFSTEHKNLATTLNIEAYPLSQSFNEGTGRFTNLPTSSNGASWLYKDDDSYRSLWVSGSNTGEDLTFGSSSLNINELPSGSQMELTINGVDFIPVISSSLFDNSTSENYIEISSSIDIFGANLSEAINLSSSLTLVSSSYISSTNTLTLSGSNKGNLYNIAVITSSISGNNQNIFTASAAGFSLQGGTSTNTSLFNDGTTGSINSSFITQGGGVWYTGSGFVSHQQFLNADNLDAKLDVTLAIQKHSASLFNSATYPTGIENHGFIIKQPESVETNTSSSFGEMKYFSMDSHTIYPPKLTFKWDDSSYSIGGGTVLNSGDIFLSLYNNKSEFQRKSKQRFRLTTRKRYPDRTFTTSSNYLNIQYLPTTSYYSIRDRETDEVIIPFDTVFTKLSADSEGMFFDLYMEGFQPERYYKIMFRSDNNDGIQIFDEDYVFKIVR
tara:strand:+ start:683 stop:2230 length:1548 start_codon:yes stop_codon:yes gene_type:complete